MNKKASRHGVKKNSQSVVSTSISVLNMACTVMYRVLSAQLISSMQVHMGRRKVWERSKDFVSSRSSFIRCRIGGPRGTKRWHVRHGPATGNGSLRREVTRNSGKKALPTAKGTDDPRIQVRENKMAEMIVL